MQCDEIELSSSNIHQQTEDIVYKKKASSGNWIKAKNGNVLNDQKDIQDRVQQLIGASVDKSALASHGHWSPTSSVIAQHNNNHNNYMMKNYITNLSPNSTK